MTAPLRLIELGGFTVVGWDLWRRLRDGSWPRLATLVPAGWLAEELAMALYGWYGYAPGWWLWLHRTPLAVALIWPLVVLTSLEVVERVRPWRASWPNGRAALGVGLLVVYDALVIEPVATRVGLWWWRGGSYFGVPLLGVTGWGLFGGVAAAGIRIGDLDGHPRRGLLLAPLIALGTHLLLAPPVLLSLRLDLRVPLGAACHAWVVGLLGLLLCLPAWRLRPLLPLRFSDISVKVAGAALFFATIYSLRLWPFALYCSSVPLPYLFLTLFRGKSARASSQPAASVRERKR